MNSTDLWFSYFHDVTGKFRGIAEAVSHLKKDVPGDEENQQILHAIHEVLVRMVETSSRTLREGVGLKVKLVVSKVAAERGWPTLKVGGEELSYDISHGALIYNWQVDPSIENFTHRLGRLMALLPIEEVAYV